MIKAAYAINNADLGFSYNENPNTIALIFKFDFLVNSKEHASEGHR